MRSLHREVRCSSWPGSATKVRILRRWGPARIGYLLGVNPATRDAQQLTNVDRNPFDCAHRPAQQVGPPGR
jgi:hypothetical protein